ncbi:MAG: hypothetical protein KGL12_11075 [Rhodospirillales bacterium]|nr:hypothetical protein [Rhodospirillales bacterium]
MKKPALIALAAATAIGVGSAGLVVRANAEPPPPPPAGAPHPGGPHWGPGMMHPHWMHHHGMRPMFEPGTFALLFHPADRQLTTADVQKIAEGFLAWNGNHSWKVVDVKADGDREIGFSFAASDGTVIAKFDIDRHSGRIKRIG